MRDDTSYRLWLAKVEDAVDEVVGEVVALADAPPHRARHHARRLAGASHRLRALVTRPSDGGRYR
jgi:hypothetical protein